MTVGLQQRRRREAFALHDAIVHEKAAGPLHRRFVAEIEQDGVDGACRRRLAVGTGNPDHLDTVKPEQRSDVGGGDDGVGAARLGIVKVAAVQPGENERRLSVTLRGVFRYKTERLIRKRYLQPGGSSECRAAGRAVGRRWGTWRGPSRCSSWPSCGTRGG